MKVGVLNICVQQEEKEFIKYLINPGNLFGEFPSPGGYESSAEYAVSLQDPLVCFLDVEKKRYWMETNADLRNKVYKQVSNDTEQPFPERLVEQLLDHSLLFVFL